MPFQVRHTRRKIPIIPKVVYFCFWGFNPKTWSLSFGSHDKVTYTR